ncbi:hypothetical protein [Bacillus paranthracis]|uniref:hypothetical protein n=1 Tax=Bacillus paranthracis TaxID=2026186 RepID=UPI003D64AA0C
MARKDRKLTTAFDDDNNNENNLNGENTEEIEELQVNTLSELHEDLMNEYTEKTKRKTIDDTHTRRTFLVEKELIKKLDRVAKGKRGFKTMAINKALKAILKDFK